MPEELFALTRADLAKLRNLLRNTDDVSSVLGSGRSQAGGEHAIFGKLQASIAAVASSGGAPTSATMDVYKFTSTGGTTATGEEKLIRNLTLETATTIGWVTAKRDSRSGQFMLQPVGGGQAGATFLIADLTTPLDPGTSPYPKVDNIRDAAGTTQAAIATSRLRNPYNMAGQNNDEVQLLEWGTQATTTGGTEAIYNVLNVARHTQVFISEVRVTTGTTNVLEGRRRTGAYGLYTSGTTWVELVSIVSCTAV